MPSDKDPMEMLMELLTSMGSDEASLKGLVDLVKVANLAKRTVEALEGADFTLLPGHPSRLSKKEVLVNPPAFAEVDRLAGQIHSEIEDEPYIIVQNVFEFISMADGSLLVVYPMLAKPTELDLDAEVAHMEWVGDIVAGRIDPDDWFPCTTIGDLTILTDPRGGSYEA